MVAPLGVTMLSRPALYDSTHPMSRRPEQPGHYLILFTALLSALCYENKTTDKR